MPTLAERMLFVGPKGNRANGAILQQRRGVMDYQEKKKENAGNGICWNQLSFRHSVVGTTADIITHPAALVESSLSVSFVANTADGVACVMSGGSR